MFMYSQAGHLSLESSLVFWTAFSFLMLLRILSVSCQRVSTPVRETEVMIAAHRKISSLR